MSSSLSLSRRQIVRGLAAILALVAVLAWWWHSQHATHGAGGSRPPLRQLPLAKLTKRDGRLYAAGETQPFDGQLCETFANGKRKLEIEIRDGKAHGRSTGYFDNGKPEVEEFFTQGVSNGVRTRWDQEGWKKSEERIEHGKLNGSHVEWHNNGTKAVELTLRDGQPEGLAEAWYPDGGLKSRTRFVAGKIVEREFFPDGTQEPTTAPSP